LIDEKEVSRPTIGLLVGICRIGCLLYADHFCTAGRKILADAGLTP
jgi:hypothetical protein